MPTLLVAFAATETTPEMGDELAMGAVTWTVGPPPSASADEPPSTSRAAPKQAKHANLKMIPIRLGAAVSTRPLPSVLLLQRPRPNLTRFACFVNRATICVSRRPGAYEKGRRCKQRTT